MEELLLLVMLAILYFASVDRQRAALVGMIRDVQKSRQLTSVCPSVRVSPHGFLLGATLL